MKGKFLIGELAKLFNISTDTLRHYDKIELLKPDSNENNGYRYYSIRNLFKLSRILFFKNLDIGLEDIKEYMKNKNINNLLSLLKKKEAEIDMKIHRQMNLKNKIQIKRQLLESINEEPDRVTVKKIPKKIGILLDFNNRESGFDLIQNLKQNEKYFKISSWLIEGQVCTSLSKEDMENRYYNKFKYFIEIVAVDDEQSEQLKMIPENEYACMTFIGPYRDKEKHYEFLIQWIDENGYLIAGDSIEENIVDYDFADSDSEYVSEIQIPVIKRI